LAHKPLSHAKALEILDKALNGRLGMSLHDEPYVVPVSFVYHRDKVYFHSSPLGRKMETLAANPRVCLQADDEITLIARDKGCTITWHFYSAHVFGRARVVEDPALRLEALQALVSKYDKEGRMPAITMEELDKNPLVVVEITPEQISGTDHARLPVKG
jgi:nitroimidazol reductase NimA-like FMN-containing flavoprotein (pyridoxamine 5'-phosphate oxidase superfamily)